MWLSLLLLACPEVEGSKVITSPTTGDPTDDTVPIVLSTSACASCAGDCRIDELAYPSSYHTPEPIAYADIPPAGGPHNPCWAAWGTHETPVPDDNWVHNLEHGGVAFLYDCEDCEADVTGIVGLATALGDFTLVTPYPDMDPGYAVVAWGWRMVSGCFDPAAAEAFYTDHVDQGPESTMAAPGEGCM